MNRRPHRVTFRMSHDEYTEFVRQWGLFAQIYPFRRTATDFVQFALEQFYKQLKAAREEAARPTPATVGHDVLSRPSRQTKTRARKPR